MFCAKRHSNIPTGTPLMGASNAGGVGRNCDFEPISGLLLALQQTRVLASALSTGSPVDHGLCSASYDMSLVVSGGVDCRRRRRNVYDKKYQLYAKDNRTAHLTASLSSFLACNSRVRIVIRRHYPPQRVVLSQICCFGECKVVLFQILLDSAEPRDAGTT